MAGITTTLKLNEEVSSKLKKISTEGRKVIRTMKSVGEAIDEAFSAPSAGDFTQIGDVINNSIESVGNKINETTGDLIKSVDDASEKLKRAFGDFGGSGLGDPLSGVEDDANSAARAIDDMNGSADTLGGTLRRLAGIAASAFAIDKLKDFGLSTLEKSAAASARDSQFTQVFNEMEESAAASLGKIADDTEILENRLKDSYISIAAFAKTTGMDTANAMDLSNRAMIAVADSAAFYDKSLEETTEALQSYLKGNYENDAFLGLASTEYTRNAEALELYGKEFQELSEEQKQWTLLSMVEEANELSGALGQAAREADTWTNQTGNLAQAWEDTKASLGDNIMEQSIGVVKSLTENMDEIEEPLDRIFSLVGDAMTEIVPMIPGGLGVLADGLELVGSALGTAYNVVSDNPKAIGTALTTIASGMVAMKAANSAKNIADMIAGQGGMTGALSSLSKSIFGTNWGAGAALVTGAVVGIGTAIEKYNDFQIENNLEDHFGSLSITDEQAIELAEQIVPVDVTAQLELANVSFDESESLINEAENLLAENRFINWKVNSVGLDLTETDAASLIQNTNEFVETVKEALEKEAYSAELAVTTLLGDVDSTGLVSQMQSWFQEDMNTVTTLGNAVTDLLQKSIDEGVNDINTQTAIEIMQAKMLQIIDGQQQAELQARMDLLEMDSPYAALDSDSWGKMMDNVNLALQEMDTAASESRLNVLETFERAKMNGHITQEEMDGLKNMLADLSVQQEAGDYATVWDSVSESLVSAYGEEFSALGEAMDGSSFMDKIIGTDWQSGLTFAQNDLESAIDEAFGGMDSGTKGALADRYEKMLPTVEQMDQIVSEAAESGRALPEAFMESYQEAMAIGAAAGNEDAMWQYMANEVAQEFPSMDEFVSTLEANGIDFTQYPEGIQEAFEKAFVSTDTSGNVGNLFDDIINSAAENGTLDISKIEEIFNEYGLSIQKYLDEQGMEIDAGEGIKIKADDFDIEAAAMNLEGLSATGDAYTLPGGEIVVEYEVEVGQTLSEIAENAGVALDDLLAANPDITNPNVIEIGQTINIPASAVTVDSSEVGAAAEEQTKESVGDLVTETTSTTKITESETDSTGAYNDAQDDLNSTFSEEMETEGHVGVQLEKQSDNINEIYNQTSSELQSAFNTTIPVTARASITIDYSIANPSATINFGGGGTGSATITAAFHAAGGIFNEPHLGWVAEAGYPEAIIPIDGSDNAFSLWKETGELLGAYNEPDDDGSLQGEVFAPTEDFRTEYVRNDSRSISININGSGEIRTNLSKEDVVALIMNEIEDIIIDQVIEDEFTEGDGTYDY